METETIHGQILSKKNHYTIGNSPDGRHPRIVKSARFRDYERSFVSQCKVYRDRMIDVPFVLFLAVYNRSKRFDIDGALTTLLDLLESVGAITNDRLCVKVVAEKRISSEPRIVFGLQPVEPSLFDEQFE